MSVLKNDFYLTESQPEGNGEGLAFPPLTYEAMTGVLLYPVMFSPLSFNVL